MTGNNIKDFSLSVTQLNKYVRTLLEGDRVLNDVFVQGEISNLKFNISGHIYFSLKDENAAISAALFRQKASLIRFKPENGMQVICRGRVSVYDKTGQYQLYVNDMQPLGAGELAIAFEQLKEKLTREGLFDEGHKKPLPPFPEKIAVITSPTGAAVQDIINILGRRFPAAEVILCPVKVQGDGAAAEMCAAINALERYGKADVIIIGRGGGSAEDLWEFNNEALARAIYNCRTPVVSAVGHETDFTICDFVSDRRAPTPSAAAELCTPDMSELVSYFSSVPNALKTALLSCVREKTKQYLSLAARGIMAHPEGLLEAKTVRLDGLYNRLTGAIRVGITGKKHEYDKLNLSLSAFDPLRFLKKGYLTASKSDGAAIRSVNDMLPGEGVRLRFYDGWAEAKINEIHSEKKGGR